MPNRGLDEYWTLVQGLLAEANKGNEKAIVLRFLHVLLLGDAARQGRRAVRIQPPDRERTPLAAAETLLLEANIASWLCSLRVLL